LTFISCQPFGGCWYRPCQLRILYWWSTNTTLRTPFVQEGNGYDKAAGCREILFKCFHCTKYKGMHELGAFSSRVSLFDYNLFLTYLHSLRLGSFIDHLGLLINETLTITSEASHHWGCGVEPSQPIIQLSPSPMPSAGQMPSGIGVIPVWPVLKSKFGDGAAAAPVPIWPFVTASQD